MTADLKDESGRMKLMFDVMPTSADKPAAAPEAAPPRQASIPRAPVPLPQPSIRQAGTPEPDREVPSRSRIPNFLIILALILLLGGAGAYAAYRYFSPSSNGASPPPPQAKESMSEDWLQQYFGSSTCSDDSVCGPEADPDKDGFINTQELKYQTSPIAADTDHDGIADIDEINIYSSDPTLSDTDGDGFEDGLEVRGGFSPTVSSKTGATAGEKQEWYAAIDRVGLHEPTPTFMAFVEFKTQFPEPSPQIAIQVPKDWTFSAASSTSTRKVLRSSDGKLSVSISSPAAIPDDTSLAAVARLQGDIHVLSNYEGISTSIHTIKDRKIVIEEFTFSSGANKMHGIAVFVPQNNSASLVRLEAADSDWAQFAAVSQISAHSVR